MANFIESPTAGMFGNPDDLTGTGGSGRVEVPDGAPGPAGGGIPFKGLEPLDDSTRGLDIMGPGNSNSTK